MKLAVYAIAKNEAKHVARWYESVKDADEIVVLDTGSTDGTQKMLSDLGVRVNNTSFDNFRFDMARNASLNCVSTDVDYCMFLDLDETMPPGSIAKIKAELESNHDMYGVRLVFTFTEKDGVRTPTVSYAREAIHRRNNFYWKFPVHELLGCYDAEYKYKEIAVDVFHEPDVNKPRTSYLALLEQAVEENPEDPRQAQYLGREHMYQGNYLDAIMWLQKHITMERHGPFRSESATYISRCYQALDGTLEEALNEAESWAFRAIAENCSAREPYCELAYLYFTCDQAECAIGMLRSALRIDTAPSIAMIHEDRYYGAWPFHLLACCYDAIGNKEHASLNIRHAMAMSTHIDSALANDIARILGLSHVSKSLASRPATPAK